MAFTVFFPVSDDEEVEISRQDVMESDDIPELLEWHGILTEYIVELSYQAKAIKEFGGYEASAAFKLARYRQAQDWCSARLDKLGKLPEKEQRQLDKMTEDRDRLKNQLDSLKSQVRKATSGLLSINLM